MKNHTPKLPEDVARHFAEIEVAEEMERVLHPEAPRLVDSRAWDRFKKAGTYTLAEKYGLKL